MQNDKVRVLDRRTESLLSADSPVKVAPGALRHERPLAGPAADFNITVDTMPESLRRHCAGLAFLLFSVLGPHELMSSASAQSGPLPWRVNCGDTNGLAQGQPGWLVLSQTSAPAGMSLSPPAVDTIHVAYSSPDGLTVLFPSDVFTLDPDQLSQSHLFTSLQLSDFTVLTIGGLAPNSPFRVRLLMGALSPWVEILPGVTWGPATISREVRVEEKTPGTSQWRTLAKDLRCTTGTKGSSLATTLGGILPVWCRVHSDASGVVQLRFSTDGGDPVYLAGFEMHAWEALPVFYKHTVAGPLQSSQPALAAFVAAFNAHDYDGAQQIALALSDPWLRGCALCHLVGWLDGSRDGRFDLIGDARAALVAAPAGHAGAAWLIDQLDQLQRALDHRDARGYSSAKDCPSDGGKGFLNPDCAGQLKTVPGVADSNVNFHVALRLLSGLCAPATGATVLADMKAWNGGTGGTAGWEPNPFVFAALKTYGTTLSDINPNLSSYQSDPESVEMIDRFRDIFLFGFLDPAYDVGDFPKDVELVLFERYAELEEHPYKWDAADLESVLTDAQIDASWWGPEVAEIPDVPWLPPWANIQRDVLKTYRSIVDYWVTERLVQGELGGGLGDDVELMLELFPAVAGQQDQGSRRQLDALDTIARQVFDVSGAVDDGYYAGLMTDVEHAAELTTNVGQSLRGAFGHTARELQNGLDVGKHLLYTANPPAAWAADTVLGRLHLKSYYFTTDGPDTLPAHAYDIPLAGRALFPSIAVTRHSPLGSSHPLAVGLRDWADGWRDDANSTAGGKPLGFFGPAQRPSNEFGKDGAWWTHLEGGANTDLLSKTQVAYTLELLRLAYHTSTAADHWRYLLPAVRMFRAAQEWEDEGQPAGTPGDTDWAAGLFLTSPRFHALVVSHLHDLETDPYLTVTDDPAEPGPAPYVDAVLKTRLHDWAESGQGVAGANLALAYAVSPVLACGSAQVTLKDQSLASGAYEAVWPYLRVAYPLLTRHAMHTDRVYLNRAQILSIIVAGHTGGNLMEGVPQRPALRWVGKLGDPLDLAVIVNGKAWDDTWVSAFACNFEEQPRVLDLWLDEGLVPGGYRIEIGPPTSKCDTFGAGAVFDTTYADKRGAGLAVPIVLEPGVNLVRVLRDGPSSAPAGNWDLALDPPELQIVKHDGLADLVLRARVANIGSAPSPPSTLTFHASLSEPDGKSLALVLGEMEAGTLPLPALAASSSFVSSESTLDVAVPISPLVGAILLSGLGVQLRAEVEAGSGDWDLLNNSLSRLWLTEEIPVVTIDP